MCVCVVCVGGGRCDVCVEWGGADLFSAEARVEANELSSSEAILSMEKRSTPGRSTPITSRASHACSSCVGGHVGRQLGGHVDTHGRRACGQAVRRAQ